MTHYIDRKIAFYLQRFFRNSILHYSIIGVYYINCGISKQQIYYIDAVYWIARFLFEFPIGWFSDKSDYRLFLATGTICFSLSYLFISLGQTITFFCLASILAAFAQCFTHSIDTACMFRNIKEVNNYKHFINLEAYGSVSRNLALSISIFIGGALSIVYPIKNIIIFSAILVLFSIPFIFMMGNNPSRNKKFSFKDICTRKLYILFILYSFALSFDYLMYWQLQIMFYDMKLSTYYIGLIFCGILILSAVFGSVHKIFKTLFCELLVIICLTMLIVLTQILSLSMWENVYPLFFFSIILYAIFRGTYVPLFKAYIAQNSVSNNYASLFSIMNVGGSFFTALLFFMFGKTIEIYGIVISLYWYFFAIVFLCLFVIIPNINLLRVNHEY